MFLRRSKMLENNIALILPIDSNKKVCFGDKVYFRFFEDEIIRNIRSWRKNGGWLKDIPVYVLLSNGETIQNKTIDTLKELNVDITILQEDKIIHHNLGFLNEPYCGKYFESINPIKEEITIKTDLDMQLLKPIPEEIIRLAQDKIIIGQYDEESLKGQREKFSNNLPFDTDLIITHKKHNFYSTYYNMCFSEKILLNEEYKKVQEQYGDYYLEEFVVDYLNINVFKNIFPLKYYQYGEGYPSIVDYPKERINDILFLHEHIYKDNKFPYDYNPIQERLNYLKLSKNKV